MILKKFVYHLIIGISLLCAGSCRNAKKPPATDIVKTPEEMSLKLPELLRSSLDFADGNEGKIDADAQLVFLTQVREVYEKNKYTPVWSNKERWNSFGDSLIYLIGKAKYYGLFPEDYHFPQIDSISKRFAEDTSSIHERKDAALWTKADLLLTDAFMHIVKDLKLGRLPQDSITLRKDSVLSDEFYLQKLELIQRRNSMNLVMHSLEPKHEGYLLLKEALPQFLDDSTSNRVFTPVPSSGNDPVTFRAALQQRLIEGGYLEQDSVQVDSLHLADAVKKFQKQQGIAIDGKAGGGTLRMLNMSASDKFARIAITLDRYKLLPEQMPDRYIWVNLPAFYMKLHDGDSVKLTSKIICGKPATRTPLLTSAISEMITYPQWTIPTSIIVKEVLPGLKRDAGYLTKKGYSLIDSKGDEVDPYTVDWTKYSKGIPYKVVQGSGDDNALGILKFNFPNKYAVYLHDTNQRYLFAQAMRSLSHGCVRVQEWEKLARYIIRYDYRDKYGDEPSPVEDSMSTWLERKEKHSIGVHKRLPVFIRYFTCEGKDGKAVFYDDMYGEDKAMRERYFAGK
ncbi:MAG TPA: L,D-transpeptidase family protein [Chitinophagaceae bacterium]|nr:L,D-transpeptidase family protein [Chitinophagaceae bacterium]